jgi:hypothetical protein
MLIVTLLSGIGAIIMLSERFEFIGIETIALIIIGILLVFAIIIIHSVIILKEKDREQKKIMRRVNMLLLLCLAPLVGQAQTTATVFVEKLVNIEMTLQDVYLRSEFDRFTSKHLDVEQNDYNYEQFARIIITHQLFTANGSYDGSMVMDDMPYMSHYVEPNPRSQIRKDNILIDDLRYNNKSLAYIDRTPDLYLSDFFSDSKYTHPVYGTFSTFGWCSEREMAYAVVLNSLGYNTFIHAPGIHAWTAVKVLFQGYDTSIIYSAGVDNTYNSTSWSMWVEPTGYSSDLEQYYNKSVNKYSSLLENIYVSPVRSKEISNLYNIYK